MLHPLSTASPWNSCSTKWVRRSIMPSSSARCRRWARRGGSAPASQRPAGRRGRRRDGRGLGRHRAPSCETANRPVPVRRLVEQAVLRRQPPEDRVQPQSTGSREPEAGSLQPGKKPKAYRGSSTVFAAISAVDNAVPDVSTTSLPRVARVPRLFPHRRRWPRPPRRRCRRPECLRPPRLLPGANAKYWPRHAWWSSRPRP